MKLGCTGVRVGNKLTSDSNIGKDVSGRVPILIESTINIRFYRDYIFFVQIFELNIDLKF
jgi:hypothetical protein